MQNRRPISRSRVARLTPVSLTTIAAVAMLIMVAMTLALPRAAYADHNSTYLVCPDPISEGNSAQMRIKRSGYRVVSAYMFTNHEYYTASPDDFVEYHGVKFESGSDEDSLRIPIETKEDATPEHDETFAIGFWDGGVWHHCEVTIEDEDAPTIANVAISSTPADKYAYRAGESIDVTLTMNGNAEVDGTPSLALFLGGETDSAWRGAEYLSGSGTRFLVFRYRVQPGDFDDDGLNVGSAASGDDGSPAYGFNGDIFAEGTDVPIEYAHPGVQGGWRQKVDGRPYVQSVWISSSPSDGWDAYRANEVIELSFTFDTAVVVEGDVSTGIFLGLDGPNGDWDAAVRRASYLRGSGTDTLVFGYTVRPGDMDPKGIMIAAGFQDNGFGGSGSIKARGTDVERNPDYLGTGNQSAHRVDTVAPSVSSLSVTSRPANGEAYGAGEVISVEVLFTENVTSEDDVRLELDVGGVARAAVLDSVSARTSNNSLVFHYTAQEGDADADGIAIAANSFTLNSGGVYDSAGNVAALAHPALPADPAHKVAAATGS